MKVSIGRFPLDGDRQTFLDIARLVETRAIVQAASGFGKSYLLCKIIEATHGHVQQIIVDPEGEFAPLRANHDFVIAAANNGDALAHPRTAGLLATRLLETKASAILDIYDVKPRERHEFVHAFVDSMMNAQKHLWHPVLVILDEAHLFCPEKGFGESEATDAVIDLAGRGRKRGFTLVAATQRIGKFNKNALAELNNKFIGSASLDVDVKRAAFELGKQPREALEDLRALKPGEFYAFGPAIWSQSPTLFRGDLPSTKLPKAGHRKLVAPPKPTAAIKALLPQLADIPKEVEQKARTEAELRKDLADVRRELEALKREPKTGMARKSDLAAEYTRGRNDGFIAGRIRGASAVYEKLKSVIVPTEKHVVKALSLHIESELKNWMEGIRTAVGVESARQEATKDPGVALLSAAHPSPHRGTPMKQPQISKKSLVTVEVDLPDCMGGPEQRVLDAIVWLEAATGGTAFTTEAVAMVARYSPTSSAFHKPRGKLNTNGMIELNNGTISITDKGRALAKDPGSPPTRHELHERVLSILDGPCQRLLKPLLERYPDSMTNEELAEAAGYSATSSAFHKPRGKLGTLGVIELNKGTIRAKDFLFP